MLKINPDPRKNQNVVRMKIKTVALACSLALSLSACLDSSSSSSTSTLSGVVATGVPVVGVTVTVTDVNGKTATSAPTDAMGNYSLSIAGLQSPYVLTAAFTEVDGSIGTLSSVSSSTGTAHANL
ncbi:MAG TPA: hypothetical protein VIM63_18965, partial [Rhodoferax sp.]